MSRSSEPFPSLFSNRVRWALCALVLASCVAGPAMGSDAGGYFVVAINQMDPDASLSFVEDDISAAATLNSAAGFGLELGYRFGPRVAFGLDASYAELDVDLVATIGGLGFSFPVVDALETATLTLGLDVFFLPEKPVTLFVGAVVGAVAYGNLDFAGFEDLIGETEVVGDTAFGGRIGADVRLGTGGWFFRAAVRKLFVDAEFEEVDVTTGLDPLIASLGFGYLF